VAVEEEVVGPMSSDNELVTMISKVVAIMAATFNGIAAQAHLVDLALVGMVFFLSKG
jgi:hypothetical protein